MKKTLLTIIILLTCFFAQAQKIGLTLAGGGARGLYHVGVIKAFEENGIPIDYVSGASMGAIVSGLYAAGYSPDEMYELFSSPEIQKWVSGKIDEEYDYYYSRFDPNASMLNVKLSFRKGQKAKAQLPMNLVSSYQLDVAFLQLMSQATAVCEGNFDSLFVPFRCNASDSYNKAELIFNKGSVPFAIRASMSIPLVFKPLQYDSVLLYDGGVYNNFPWQALRDDFAPDFYIGSVCSGGVDSIDLNNVIQQITMLATFNTDYTLPEGKSFTITGDLSEYKILDYAKGVEIMDKGYTDAMAIMPELLQKISRRESPADVAERRACFKKRIPPLMFDQINIEGLTPHQETSVRNMLDIKEGVPFTSEQFKDRYFFIIQTGNYTGEFPSAQYNPETQMFTLNIKMKAQNVQNIMLGGNISSTSLNQLFLGVEYRHVGKQTTTALINGYLGTSNSSVLVGARHDIFKKRPYYIDYYYGYNYNDYTTSNNRPYSKYQEQNVTSRGEHYFVTTFALPFSRRSAFRLSATGGVQTDRYFQYAGYNVPDMDKPDRSQFAYLSFGAEIETALQNYTLFPTKGIRQLASLHYVLGNERYRPGTISVQNTAGPHNRWWFVGKYFRNEIFSFTKWLSLGYTVDVTISNTPEFYNPTITNIMFPAFTPTIHSKTMFMSQFRSQSYVGGGVSPIFKFTNAIYLQTDFYVFLPGTIVYDNEKFHGDIWNRLKGRTQVMYGGSLVYQTIIGPASLTVAKYNTNKQNWHLVFNFGYLLFNKGGLRY